MEVKDYMKLSKKRLAELLVERDAREAMKDNGRISIPTYELPCYHGGLCTNPFHDCINCPHKDYSSGVWVDNTCTEFKPMYETYERGSTKTGMDKKG